ncbi:helix-turn-helix domain-containing protein [Bacteroides fragilis]|jgi:AraC-like DNA-binding protein|uniref:helix-turn-helix domain-containing protein n=1 Tax=Bacteroides fragilis TaxID=817 RepID=UPI002453F4A7|nr:helix-turn-helix transcriptional regulator [Bacteroides fragilis]
MEQNLIQILMNEAIREGWREWMERVRVTLPQTDVERPVTWVAAERLAQNRERMVRLLELLRQHRPILSYRVREEAGLLVLVAYHRHGGSTDFLLETAEAYFRERDTGGFLFLCRMQAAINVHDEYPHLNGLYSRLAGLLFRFRRERAAEYRKGIQPMFSGAELQEVERYLPHLRSCSFREEIALALPKVRNVEELARECGMSVNTLGRRFKEELDTTPHRWLTEQRKAHVTSLLADTDMPFQEIADVCGFATPSYLWDFCKKHLKATPAEIREIARCAKTV